MRQIVVVAYPQVVLVHAAVTLERVGHLDLVSPALFVLVLRLGSGLLLGWGGSALVLVPAGLSGERGLLVSAAAGVGRRWKTTSGAL